MIAVADWIVGLLLAAGLVVSEWSYWILVRSSHENITRNP